MLFLFCFLCNFSFFGSFCCCFLCGIFIYLFIFFFYLRGVGWGGGCYDDSCFVVVVGFFCWFFVVDIVVVGCCFFWGGGFLGFFRLCLLLFWVFLGEGPFFSLSLSLFFSKTSKPVTVISFSQSTHSLSHIDKHTARRV